MNGAVFARCHQENTVGQVPSGDGLHCVIVQHEETATYERHCHPFRLVFQPFTVLQKNANMLARCHQGNTVGQVSSCKPGAVPNSMCLRLHMDFDDLLLDASNSSEETPIEVIKSIQLISWSYLS